VERRDGFEFEQNVPCISSSKKEGRFIEYVSSTLRTHPRKSEVPYMDYFSIADVSGDLGSLLLLLEECLIKKDEETIAERILEHNESIEEIVPPTR
jgi:hypothetical protein